MSTLHDKVRRHSAENIGSTIRAMELLGLDKLPRFTEIIEAANLYWVALEIIAAHEKKAPAPTDEVFAHAAFPELFQGAKDGNR